MSVCGGAFVLWGISRADWGGSVVEGRIGGLSVVVVALRGRRKMPVEREESFDAERCCTAYVNTLLRTALLCK